MPCCCQGYLWRVWWKESCRTVLQCSHKLDYSNNVFLPVFTVRAAVPGTLGQELQSQALLWQAQQLETTAVARNGPNVTTTTNQWEWVSNSSLAASSTLLVPCFKCKLNTTVALPNIRPKAWRRSSSFSYPCSSLGSMTPLQIITKKKNK